MNIIKNVQTLLMEKSNEMQQEKISQLSQKLEKTEKAQTQNKPQKNQQNKQLKKQVDGILLLNKPKGISSNKAIQIAKRLFQAKKVGHSGTLDPLATGLLVVLFGEATKFASYGLDANKSYRAILQLGQSTASGDSEGEFLQQAPVPFLDLSAIKTKLNSFLGENMQVPPVYSALKHQGKKLYELALAGTPVEKPARQIFIHNLQFTSYKDQKLEFIAQVSKGTYIRKLGEDFAKALGTLGYLLELERLSSGKLKLDFAKCLTLDELEQQKGNGACLEDFLYPPDFLLEDFAKIDLEEEDFRDLIYGKKIKLANKLAQNLPYKLKIGDNVRLYFCNNFIGLGCINSEFELVAKRLLNTKEFLL